TSSTPVTATTGTSARRSRTSTCRAEVAEAKAQEQERHRRPLQRMQRRLGKSRKREALRRKERPQVEPVEARSVEIGTNVLDAILPRVQVEDELLVRVTGDQPEEGLPIARVVDRAEARRRGDRLGRLVLVEIGQDNVTAAPTRRLDLLRARVDAAVDQPRQM